MRIYIGTSGYGYKEWRGKFYPEKTPPKEMLRYYSGRLDAVEMNNTFYHMPGEALLSSWAEQVPDGFIFAVKAPQVITHLKRLKNVGEVTEYLFRSLSVLKRKLGPVLFQLPESFHADGAALKDLLGLIPAGLSCAFEFRSPSWLTAEILDLLHDRGCSLCIVDSDEKPTEKITNTATWGYLRLRRSGYSDADLSRWLELILSQRWKRAFVFFKHEEEAKGPAMAMRLRELAGVKGKRH